MVLRSKHFSAIFQQDMIDMFNASFIPRLSLIDILSCIMGLILSNTQLSYPFVDLILVLLSGCWQHHSCSGVGVFIGYDNTNLCLIRNLLFRYRRLSIFLCIEWNITKIPRVELHDSPIHVTELIVWVRMDWSPYLTLIIRFCCIELVDQCMPFTPSIEVRGEFLFWDLYFCLCFSGVF